MRHRLVRLSPVLFAVVAAGGFVGASALPATAEPDPQRRDRLHQVRPIAAPDHGSIHLAVAIGRAEAEAHAEAQAAAHGEARAGTADAAPPAARSVASPTEPSAGPSAGPSGEPSAVPVRAGACAGDVECFLACTRAHESDTAGGYGAVSAGGTYRGAYQFHQRTWDAAVTGAGFGEYAGIPADEAPPAVQDAAAAHLYSVSGNRPWGGRC